MAPRRPAAQHEVNPLKRERIHLLLIEDARKGLEDIKAGRVHDADKAIATLQQRRKAKSATAARSAEQRE